MNEKAKEKEEKQEMDEEIDWDELTREAEEARYSAEIHQRPMCFDFDSKDKNAPKDVNQLEKMVQAEVDVCESPDTERELQDAISKCEIKTREICQRYEMSFSFLKERLIEVDTREIRWKWTLNKRKPT